MVRNGNPPLFFEPTNDVDDYTMVTCPINEEFAYIRDHEDVATRKSTEKTVSKAQDATPNVSATTPKADKEGDGSGVDATPMP